MRTPGWAKRVENYLKRTGGRLTSQRLQVARVFMEMEGHPSVTEIHQEVVKLYPRIGRATVYRTLKLLVDAGLASVRDFGNGVRHYEPVKSTMEHYHLVCTLCHKIVEFTLPQLGKEAVRVAREHGFEFTGLEFEVRGLCPECARKVRQ